MPDGNTKSALSTLLFFYLFGTTTHLCLKSLFSRVFPYYRFKKGAQGFSFEIIKILLGSPGGRHFYSQDIHNTNLNKVSQNALPFLKVVMRYSGCLYHF